MLTKNWGHLFFTSNNFTAKAIAYSTEQNTLFFVLTANFFCFFKNYFFQLKYIKITKQLPNNIYLPKCVKYKILEAAGYKNYGMLFLKINKIINNCWGYYNLLDNENKIN